jgi:TPP-dependent pyruvate/acetoin dehydrogenase alpha subunit
MTIASSKAVPLAGATPPHNGFSLISNEKLLELYSTMLKCRMIQTRIRTLAIENGSISLHAAVGREATVAGVCLDLLPGDTLAPSHHGYIASFVKGLPFAAIFSALSPRVTRSRPRYAPLHLIPPSLSLSAQLERALSAARENKASKNKKIAVAFCGSSTAAPDILHEAMRQAGKRNLPMLLVCHSDAHVDDICLKAQDCGFPGVPVDGDDAVAVYRVGTEAMAHARRGSGPTLIDCKPWSPSGEKSAGHKTTSDSIARMEEYLTRKGLFDKKFKSAVTASFRRELDAAIDAPASSPS